MIWFLLTQYVWICLIAHLVMFYMYLSKDVETLEMPKQRWVYYLLSFTWGLPMNLVGAIVAGIIRCTGRKPKKWGWNWYFELPVNFGMELGIFSIVPENPSERIRNHEFGHSIQNIYLGPFTIGVVCIPSFVRFWIRELSAKMGMKPETGYDDIWFEGQATKSGAKFMQEHKDN